MVEKPTKEVIGLLKVVSEKCDVSMVDIKTKYNEIYERKSIQTLKVNSKAERQKHAARILFAEMISGNERIKYIGKPVDITMRIYKKREILAFKNKITGAEGYRSEIYGIVQDQEDNISAAKLVLWDDGNECHPLLLEGKTYSTKAVIGKRNGIWQMSMNKQESVEDSDIDLPEFKDAIAEIYSPITIEEVETNISRDRADSKLVTGIVISNWQTVTTSGKDMGFLKIIDELNPDLIFVAKFMNEPNIVNSVSLGDLVYVLGQCTAATLNDDGTEQYPVGMWGELIVPIISIESESKKTEEETEETEETESEETEETEETESEETDDIEEKIAEW